MHYLKKKQNQKKNQRKITLALKSNVDKNKCNSQGKRTRGQTREKTKITYHYVSSRRGQIRKLVEYLLHIHKILRNIDTHIHTHISTHTHIYIMKEIERLIHTDTNICVCLCGYLCGCMSINQIHEKRKTLNNLP